MGRFSITGTRIVNSAGVMDVKTYRMLRDLGADKEIMFVRNKYILPESPIEITTFRGGVINPFEMELVYKKSTAFDALLKDNFTVTDSTKKRKSILPFTVGQLGLILTSGCMDGLIEDEDGSAHLIKGRIVKNTSTTEEVEGTKRIVTNVHSNHVEIKAFLPTGELKVLN